MSRLVLGRNGLVHLTARISTLPFVLDAFSRRVIGWYLSDHLRASLAPGALEIARRRRDTVPGGPVHRSDRGTLGGFKGSSQHLHEGWYDISPETPFGSIRAATIVLTRPPAGSRTR